MKHQLLLLFLSLTYVCFGQMYIEEENAINFKDIIEIKGLMYFKADTTMVTGRVVRYNKKNKAKRYVDVVEGKPKTPYWINIQADITDMEDSELGTLLLGATWITGLAMAVTGNDINIPVNDFNNANGRNFGPEAEEKYKSKIKLENEKRMISNNIDSNSKPDIIEAQKLQFIEVKKSQVIEVPKDGLYEEYFENKILRQTGNYVEGKKQGPWKEWYENGQLMRSVVYLNGKKEGLLETYHPNGQLQGKVNYLDGKEEGRMMVYNDKGEITLVGFFKEGIQAGEWFYYEDGKLILTENYD